MSNWDEFRHEGFIVMFNYREMQFYIVDYVPSYRFDDLRGGGNLIRKFSELVRHWENTYKRVTREVYLNE